MISLLNEWMLWRLRWRSWLAQERYLLDPTTENLLAADHWINKEMKACKEAGEWFSFHNPKRDHD